jgi:hypothetical protein
MSEHQPPASHCANCGHRLAPWDHYCSQCGQDTAGHPPSLWEFVHEWLLHYVAFEGKLWKSLWALLARPGFLTQEYLAGRKQRYVLPLRLLLSFGLLFFVALKFSPDLLDQAVQLDEAAQAAGRAASQPAAARPAAALPPAAASALQGALQQAARETASAPASPVVMNAKDREGLPAWLRGPLERVEKRWSHRTARRRPCSSRAPCWRWLPTRCCCRCPCSRACSSCCCRNSCTARTSCSPCTCTPPGT